MQIITKLKYPEQYSITELENGEVYRLSTDDTLYMKISASYTPTPYDYVNLANGVLGTISEDNRCLLKVEGAFLEDYDSNDNIDLVWKQLAAEQDQCNQLRAAQQKLKNDYQNLERQIEDQEKQLAERAMSIERLKADYAQLQNVCDDYRTRCAKREHAYKDVVNDFDNLFMQLIDAAYLGEMQGLEDAVLEDPQRLIDKIRGLANTVKQFTKKDSEEEDTSWKE